MANQPATPHRTIRVPDTLWTTAQARAAATGRTMTAVIADALTDYTSIYTADDALAVLVAEGHHTNDVHAAIDSLIDAGLELDQPDDGHVISAAELDLLREQLAA